MKRLKMNSVIYEPDQLDVNGQNEAQSGDRGGWPKLPQLPFAAPAATQTTYPNPPDTRY